VSTSRREFSISIFNFELTGQGARYDVLPRVGDHLTKLLTVTKGAIGRKKADYDEARMG
jgi:hypothetical protein